MNPRLKAVLAVPLFLALGACDGVPAETGGDATVISDSRTVPADWPADIALYKDATVERALVKTDSRSRETTLTLRTPISPYTVEDFYRMTLGEAKWQYDGTFDGDGTTQILCSKPRRSLITTIRADADAATTIILQLTEDKT